MQNAAQIDLLGVLCSRLQYTSPCAHYYNSVAMSDIFRSAELSRWHLDMLLIPERS